MNSSEFKLAPPTKTPSTLLISKISEEFFELTDPPYKIGRS